MFVEENRIKKNKQNYKRILLLPADRRHSTVSYPRLPIASDFIFSFLKSWVQKKFYPTLFDTSLIVDAGLINKNSKILKFRIFTTKWLMFPVILYMYLHTFSNNIKMVLFYRVCTR